MKKIITFTSEWNTISKKIIDFLEEKSKTHEFAWKNYEFSNFRTLAKEHGVEAPQTCLLLEDEEVIQKTQGVFDEKILLSWISDFAAPAIVEDVVLEAEPVLEAVLEAEAVVEAELVADEATEVVLEEVVEDEPVVEVELEEESIVNDEELVQDEPIVEDDIVIENEEPIKHETPVTIKKEPVSIIDLIDDTVIFDGAVFDDEFSSEDLGNDTPEDVVDPEDLF